MLISWCLVFFLFSHLSIILTWVVFPGTAEVDSFFPLVRKILWFIFCWAGFNGHSVPLAYFYHGNFFGFSSIMRNSIAKYICISYFSVSVIQHHDQRLLCRKIYVGLTFQREGQSWWGRQRSRSRKLAGHIFSCTQEVERELDVAQTLKARTQSCTSSSRATYPQHSTTSPEKSIWRPGIQIHEPVGATTVQ